jgi:hypothetical protein
MILIPEIITKGTHVISNRIINVYTIVVGSIALSSKILGSLLVVIHAAYIVSSPSPNGVRLTCIEISRRKSFMGIRSHTGTVDAGGEFMH